MDSGDKKSLTYKTSGVDIDAGERAVDMIKDLARSTFIPGVASGLGGFSGLFSLKEHNFTDPVLVSGTDGVGTKLKIAFTLDKHDTIGIDAVAMCVNDVVCCGAKPLFFLDYIATGRIEPEKVVSIISGIAEGCRQAGCALIGGEMAEMPGFYSDGEYDIAGFSVGAVERTKIIDGSRIQAGDVLAAIPSSGVHSNGFSLIRKIIEVAGLDLSSKPAELGGATLGEAILTPTRIYAKQVQELAAAYDVRGFAHITGGGLEGNIVRIIPKGLGISVDWSAWKRPAVFDVLAAAGNVEEAEMRRVFNLGAGLVAIMPAADAQKAIASDLGKAEGMFRLGEVVKV